ncbi:hypothetical protein [Thalassotalea litorea]|uniref:hypothetical protein n=1 Tax=Thalassotalea litorea TaxID=2020715 RepID=UPI00373681F7
MPEQPQRKKSKGLWQKYLLGIFFVAEDIPDTAAEFLDRVNDSKNRSLILGLLACFWLALAGIILVSVLFFKGSDTLFNVVASTEKLHVDNFDGVEYPTWRLEDVTLYNDCGTESEIVSGDLTIYSNSEIEFERIGAGKLLITLFAEEEPADENESGVGKIDGFINKLSDCVVFEYLPSQKETYTFPVDGNMVIGGAIKESVTRTPLLQAGKIYIADKAIMSGEYYVSEPYELMLGDKFSINKATTQSSGIIVVDDTPGINVTYAGKGESGNIERYKLESIKLENTIWFKLLNDETVISLWILLIVLYTAVKVIIRLSLD